MQEIFLVIRRSNDGRESIIACYKDKTAANTRAANEEGHEWEESGWGNREELATFRVDKYDMDD